MSKNTGGPAFALHIPASSWTHSGGGSGAMEVTHSGMTLRDYFAAKAMQGMCYNPRGDRAPSLNSIAMSEIAYECADAMLKEREK